MKIKEKKKPFLTYIITFSVCAILTVVVLLIRKVFWQETIKDTFKVLVDSFFIVGVLTMCGGAILALSDGGAFEMLVYGMRRFFSIFQKDPNKIKYVTFYDYKVARAEQEKTSKWFLLIIGGIFVAISLILLIFWYQY